jgi:uncharacterized membrane protein
MSTSSRRRIITRFIWTRLKVSFGFVPLFMSLGAIVLACLMNWVDLLLPNEILQESHFILPGGISEMRAMLINISAAILGTAGVVFSLINLPLSAVASQFGSRLLRVYTADHTVQFVLGMFAGTFAYCITVAFLLPKDDASQASPQVSVTFAIFLMLATITSLILLIQHISTMLQAPNIVAAAGAELREVVNAMDFRALWQSNDRQSIQQVNNLLPGKESYAICAQHTGYIEYIRLGTILTLARKKNLTIQMLCKPGQFVWPGMAVAITWSDKRAERLVERQVRRAFLIGNQRLPTQDFEYAVNQLVEIAVRAMTSGIRDPFTTLTCLDHLGVGLAQFARQGEMSHNFYDREGQLRFILIPITFAELLNASFDMIRRNGRENARILLHMLKVIEIIDAETKSPAVQRELARHVCLIQAESRKSALIEQDLQLIDLRCEALQAKFAATSLVEAPSAPAIP